MKIVMMMYNEVILLSVYIFVFYNLPLKIQKPYLHLLKFPDLK